MTKRKHGIRPPRKPRDELAEVTIANQEKQIRLLIDRCADLEAQRVSLEKAFNMTGSLAEQLSKVQIANIRLLGWQDCAREILGLALNSTAPGS